MKVGPCMSACAGSSDQNASNTFLRAIVAASGRGAAGQRLAERHNVGNYARGLECEQRAGAAETGKNLIEDQQNVVAVGRFAQRPQYLRVVEAHAARALHQRLDDDGRNLLGPLCEQQPRTRLRSLRRPADRP